MNNGILKAIKDWCNEKFQSKGNFLAKLANNLLTTEEGFALDARQGTALQGEIDEINSNLSLEAQKLTAIIDQMYYKKIARDSLKNNLLLVNLNTEYADANKTRIFNKPLSNVPIDDEYFMGIWICHWHSINHVMVELIEMYPVAGRRWTNFYNSTKWTGWHSITSQ